MQTYPKLKDSVIAAYLLWKNGGHTPYEYLFHYPRNRMEIDWAVFQVGQTHEDEIYKREERKSKVSQIGHSQTR